MLGAMNNPKSGGVIKSKLQGRSRETFVVEIEYLSGLCHKQSSRCDMMEQN